MQKAQIIQFPKNPYLLEEIRRYETSLTGGAPCEGGRYCGCPDWMEAGGLCEHLAHLINELPQEVAL